VRDECEASSAAVGNNPFGNGKMKDFLASNPKDEKLFLLSLSTRREMLASDDQFEIANFLRVFGSKKNFRCPRIFHTFSSFSFKKKIKIQHK